MRLQNRIGVVHLAIGEGPRVAIPIMRKARLGTATCRPSHFSNQIHAKPIARGFTLIELLLAVVIFAVVLSAINGVFYGALQLRNKTTRMLEESLPIQQTIAILRRDLAGIVAPTGTFSNVLQSAASIGLQSTGAMGAETGTEIYTNTGVVDDRSPWAEVQKVAYYLRNPTNRVTATGKDLIRAVTRNVLAPTEDLPAEQWLMGDVERIAFTFYNGTDWRESWDSTNEETGLPAAIKVQIQLAERESRPGTPSRRRDANPPIEIVVPIVVTARASQVASTGGQR